MEPSYLILLAIFVVSLFIRTGYELLKEGGKVNLENKLIFASIFTTMCALWTSWFGLCPLDPFRVDLPAVVSLSGLGLFVLGIILAVGALLQLRGLENIKHLVTSGFFAKIRHPMYTGFMLWILGWSTYHGAWVSLLVGLLGIGNILYWKGLEDSRLVAQHGDAYRQYKVTTWF